MNTLPYVVEARRRPLVSRTCPDCEGYGEGSLDHPGDPEARVLQCESCCGTGTVEVEAPPCMRCGAPELPGERYCLSCVHEEARVINVCRASPLDVLHALAWAREELQRLGGEPRCLARINEILGEE